ncbi:MAG: DNA-binding transcriptional regulator [Phycisphaerales bacterium]|jgi:LacI family transcriptional regulator|nr:DNA-binding transcriptional regulator [Phycisphaerales bacterium]
MPQRKNILLVIETSKSFGRNLLHGIGRFIRETSARWAVYTEERGKRENLPTWMKEFHGDGIISHSNSPAMIEALGELGLPLVETDMCGMDRPVPLVYSNEKALCEMAVTHFTSRGIQKIAWCQLVNREWANFRHDALLEALNDAGVELVGAYRPSRQNPGDWLSQRSAMCEWIESLPKPVGVLCANDLCGSRLLDAARQISVAIPERIAVLGVDNDPVLCNLTTPPLSSIDQNAELIGYRSAALLENMMAGSAAPKTPDWVDPLSIVTRQSTDIIAIENPDVAQAVKFIRANACRNITVSDVVDASTVSRSLLEKLFRETLGRSPKAEIMRIRIERACQLLRGSMPVTVIAMRCGFSSSQYFANVFQREMGVSPSLWRKQKAT